MADGVKVSVTPDPEGSKYWVYLTGGPATALTRYSEAITNLGSVQRSTRMDNVGRQYQLVVTGQLARMGTDKACAQLTRMVEDAYRRLKR